MSMGIFNHKKEVRLSCYTVFILRQLISKWITEVNMFVFIRAITYAALFIGLVLIYVPAQILSWTGILRPEIIELPQIAGMVTSAVGAGIALWCVFTFATIGKGTPAPFDPPRRLVTRGPYQFVRNPMYIGAGLALIGAALFYESLSLLGYVGILFVITHSFMVWYEEPTLRRTFGGDYEDYCRKVRRWLPSVQRDLSR
jgi:protein-S-isoprenylcysteine O-methyltransferase Ste14